jgi:glycosyltransferase involved in cell wall biosynthesis
MKIVLVHNTYQQPGGEDAVFRSERDLLRSAGHDIVEYQRSNGDVRHYVSIRQLVLAQRTIWASDTRQEFRQLLLRERPHIVHVHNTFVMVSPSIYWACQDVQVPVVQTLHNYRLLCPGGTFLRDGKVCEECMENGVWRGVRYGCYRGSRAATGVVAAMLTTHRFLGTWSQLIDYYLVPTQFGRRKFIAGGLPPDKLLVKPNFVYPDPGAGNCYRPYALFVGRLSREKGLRTLLSAWARLRSSVPLHIIGDGPLRAEHEEYVRQHGLSNVCFRGALKWDQAMAAMKEARCLFFPSECYEGLPMTVIEAFACGTPVIASRMGAMKELVSDGRTGLQFTPCDAEELARKAEWAWTHPMQMAEMGEQARREYQEKYTAASNYGILLETYQRAIQKYRARHSSVKASLVWSAVHFGSQQNPGNF